MAINDAIATAIQRASAASAAADAVTDPALLTELDQVKASRSWHDDMPESIVMESVEGWSGTVSFYIAPAGSQLIPRIRQAASSGDVDTLTQIQLEMLTAYSELSPLDPQSAVSAIAEAPGMVDLRYGTKLVTANMAVPDFATFGMVSVAYAGPAAPYLPFVARTFPRDNQDFSYETLLLVSPARLSAFESGLVESLHDIDDEVMVGDEVGFAPLIVTTLLLTLAATTLHTPFIATTGCPSVQSDRLISDRLTPELVERLGNRASVRELVRARELLLEADNRRRS